VSKIIDPMQNIVDLLCDTFKIKRIEVRISGENYSYYDPGEGHIPPTIWISILDSDDYFNVCLHEMAHHLHAVRFPSTKLAHTSLYCKILDCIVRKVFVDPCWYGWNSEYIIVQKYALKRKYIKKINRNKL